MPAECDWYDDQIDERDMDDGYCECGESWTIEELSIGYCGCCGLPLPTWEYP